MISDIDQDLILKTGLLVAYAKVYIIVFYT